jgi:hypothetical protein
MPRRAVAKQSAADPVLTPHVRLAPKPPTGLDALRDDPALVAVLRDEVMAMAARAREDICVFFEFVMRTFESEPVFLAPHHRVALEFLTYDQHDRCVLMMPVGGGKTFLTLGLTLWTIGRDVTTRGCIVSASQQQAHKTLAQVRQYIEESTELAMVFPHLRRSRRPGDPWTQDAITVERPRGIKDPTLVAFGVDTKGVLGSRLNWLLADDILNGENTGTKEARDGLSAKFQSDFLSRINWREAHARVVMANTPWHPDDAVERASKPPSADGNGGGWATMRMDAYGDITVYDDVRVEAGWRRGWDSDLLRPSHPGRRDDPRCRLVAHDPDPGNERTLWAHKWPTAEFLDRQRVGTLPVVFNQTFRCIVRDDASAMCPAAYVETCFRVARALGVRSFAVNGDKPAGGPFLHVFTGVDLAFKQGEHNDSNAIFTFGVREDGIKVLLDLVVVKAPPPRVSELVFDAVRRFDSLVGVEENGGGAVLISFMRANKVSYPVKAFRTGKEKWDPEHGVATFFAEMEDGSWAFPWGRPPAVNRLVEECLDYSPTKHTGDCLMAAFVGRKYAKKFGVLNGQGPKAEARALASSRRYAEQRAELDLRQARGVAGGAGGMSAAGQMAGRLLAR